MSKRIGVVLAEIPVEPMPTKTVEESAKDSSSDKKASKK
jgi:hypothetical protein